mmetsp:Transcript_61891/g.174957  ORF Transcript_61891/g.174957 Transcript_61891/m.174957 type:complete len:201 (+) Transcript_61891:790-1392(+)
MEGAVPARPPSSALPAAVAPAPASASALMPSVEEEAWSLASPHRTPSPRRRPRRARRRTLRRCRLRHWRRRPRRCRGLGHRRCPRRVWHSLRAAAAAAAWGASRASTRSGREWPRLSAAVPPHMVGFQVRQPHRRPTASPRLASRLPLVPLSSRDQQRRLRRGSWRCRRRRRARGRPMKHRRTEEKATGTRTVRSVGGAG